jgi:hypothetical protein
LDREPDAEQHNRKVDQDLTDEELGGARRLYTTRKRSIELGFRADGAAGPKLPASGAIRMSTAS